MKKAHVPRTLFRKYIDDNHGYWGIEEKPGFWWYYPQFTAKGNWHNYAGDEGKPLRFTTEVACRMHLYRLLNQGKATGIYGRT